MILSLFKTILLDMFVTIATVEVKRIPDFYVWAILLMNQSEEIGEEQLSVLCHRVGQISPFMCLALWYDHLSKLHVKNNCSW